MRRPSTHVRRLCGALAGAVVSAGVLGRSAEHDGTNARLRDPTARMAMAQAIRAAASFAPGRRTRATPRAS
jgi:hypothetical protein